MRPIPTLLTLSTGLLATTSAAGSARIYTFDTEQQESSSTSSHGETLSADTARLILAQRLGSSQFSELGDADDKVLEQLNKYGGAQQPILGALDGDSDTSKLLVVLEGVDMDIASSVSKMSSGDFVVDNVQDGIVQQGLVDSLLTSKASTGSSPCSYDFESDDVTGTLAFNVLSTENCPSKDSIFQQSEGKVRLNNLKASSWMGRGTTAVLKIKTQPTEVAPDLQMTFPELATHAKDSKQESTLILLPPGSSAFSQKSTATKKNKITRRDAQYSYASSTSSATSIPDSDFPSTLLPVCHTSNSSCVDATNNCSGHGSCYKKYGSSDGDDSGDCYACRCERTIVRKNDGGTVKTVQWGGPACQKKDVSIPFWLLAGFTVLLVSVVSWAIGLLYSIGDAELPSVIGAGVSGGKQK